MWGRKREPETPWPELNPTTERFFESIAYLEKIFAEIKALPAEPEPTCPNCGLRSAMFRELSEKLDAEVMEDVNSPGFWDTHTVTLRGGLVKKEHAGLKAALTDALPILLACKELIGREKPMGSVESMCKDGEVYGRLSDLIAALTADTDSPVTVRSEG